jgi:hypothetical protein
MGVVVGICGGSACLLVSTDAFNRHFRRNAREVFEIYAMDYSALSERFLGDAMRGSCLCGEVEFQIDGDLSKIYQCHCSLCRKQGGSSSNSSVIADMNNFRWISGQEKISSYVKPTGFRSDFCSRCGSPVPNPLRTTKYYWVPAGLLDDNVSLEVGVHLFVGSKASWDAISSGVPQYETMPKPSEFFELMHSRV